MSKNVQNVTLSMTLPISCQICFGKVRKPMICCNLHIFCATCIELWLQKCSQCPTCRVPITAENPCREIIGATNESEANDSHSFKSHLRKTRGELLLREYEDELETLLKENKDLKSRTESLESQLKASLNPAAAPFTPSDTLPDSALLGETANKLQAATELYQRVQEDMTKLKKANSTLRSQNVHLLQENLRLRAEVESRSPHKFGRFTVAALEAKISQYEREMSQLKKALERSDAYIEELEFQSVNLQSSTPSPSTSSDQTEDRRSPKLDMTSADPPDPLLPPADEASGSQQDAAVNFAVPSTPPTPSSVLGRLSLKSPAVQSETKAECSRVPYLRRLSFDDCGSSSRLLSVSSVENATPKVSDNLFKQKPSVHSANRQSVWSRWEEPYSSTLHSTRETQQKFSEGVSLAEEARMNAAFLDIVSELHSMMAEGESSRSHMSQVPTDLDSAEDLDVQVDPESARKQQHDAAESSGDSVKRKCPASLATSSPSKMSRNK